MKILIFVFGTLKEGFPNFHTNRGHRLAGTFMTQERFPLYLVGERYSPWLIHAPGEGHRVIGQVFEVDPIALDAMDQLERVAQPDGYRRVVLDVRSIDRVGPAVVLHVNVYVKPPCHLLSSDIRQGPLRDYTHDHAALYRPRT